MLPPKTTALKRRLSFIAGVSLLLLLVLHQSCRKTDLRLPEPANPEQIENFLKTDDSTSSTVIQLAINDLRNQLYKHNFVDYFLLNHGQPLWNKALMLTGSKNTQGKVNCIIPVVNKRTNEVTAYIKCNNLNQEGFVFKIYSKAYIEKRFAASGEHAIKFVKDLSLFVMFEKKLNNKSRIPLNGTYLTLDTTNETITPAANLADPCGSGGTGPGGGPGTGPGGPGGGGGEWVTTCVDYICPVCHLASCKYSYTVCTTEWVPDANIVGCPGGGSGGGTGGDGDPDPCPATNLARSEWYEVSNALPCNSTPDTTSNPCNPFIGSLQNDANFISKFNSLNQNTGSNFETGFVVRERSSNSYYDRSGTNSSRFMDYGLINYKLDGFLHCHYTNNSSGQMLSSMFSCEDLTWMARVYLNGLAKDTNNLFFGVVSAIGQPYLIKVSDPASFRTFAQKITGFNGDDQNIMDKFATDNNGDLSPDYSNSGTENNFLHILKSYGGLDGLSLFKGNNDCSRWTELTLSANGNVIPKPCF